MTATAAKTLTAQIEEAREAGDWDKHAELWEQRRVASVDADEGALKTDYVIRSMSTTDYVAASHGSPAQKPVPYHVYLLPAHMRSGAWWTARPDLAMKFATKEDAQIALDASTLGNAEIAPIDADARRLPTFWENQKARSDEAHMMMGKYSRAK